MEKLQVWAYPKVPSGQSALPPIDVSARFRLGFGNLAVLRISELRIQVYVNRPVDQINDQDLMWFTDGTLTCPEDEWEALHATSDSICLRLLLNDGTTLTNKLPEQEQ
jgi:hypothetical protein